MSKTSSQNGIDASLAKRVGTPPAFEIPDTVDGKPWTLSTSWYRAVAEDADVSPVRDAEWMVSMETSEDYHRLVFVLDQATLRAECSCAGWTHRDWCPHVATLWWRWVRGQLQVTHYQTGHEYETPPEWYQHGERDVQIQVSRGMTSAELDAYLTCELGQTGVREYARKTDRAPGTIGNLLRRARNKAGGQA
ncbi:SWIM zinc finger family protein [Halovenus marina]|uniref:SWIM zinc finger family protein n=1 Tax=Halovenus marina TaxID=3396621 RepID=UPI003F5498B1